MEVTKRLFSSCVIVLICASLIATVHSIGVNYGTIGNNLPPPVEVAKFLKEKTSIDRIKIFSPNADILRAFAETGILVAVTVPNAEVPALANLDNARKWVESNLRPFYPQTSINYLCVGDEIFYVGEQNMKENLVPAMKSLHQALVESQMGYIKVTTAHSLDFLESTSPPSSAKFKSVLEKSAIVPLLEFLRDTKSPFMVNPYTYFGSNPSNEDFALFKRNTHQVYDKVTNQWYHNMYDMHLDAVFYAIKSLGFGDVDIVLGSIGWPSNGENKQAENVNNAATFNGEILRKYNTGEGTPLMPHKKFETYIFGLFNENLKAKESERNFGLFNPDFTPVYNIGITKEEGKKWCVAKQEATDVELQLAIDWVCNQDIDCRPIQAGGTCFEPNNVKAHAAYAMNAFYQAKAKAGATCDFKNSAIITYTNPSYGSCTYQA